MLCALWRLFCSIRRRDGTGSPEGSRRHDGQGTLRTGPQTQGDGIFGRLLAFERYLGRHDALPLGDQVAFRAGTVAESAVSFVAFEPADHAVVATPRAFRLSGAFFRERINGCRVHRDWMRSSNDRPE